VVAALIAGLSTSTWLLIRERLARQRAVAAEQQMIGLLEEARIRQKLTQATVFLSRDKTEEADNLIGGIRVPEANLEYAAVFRTLGDWHATRTHWREAADRFAVLLQINQPDDWDTATLDYLRYGPVLLEAADLPEYERFRHLAITHYANTANALPAERVIKISLLIPADNSSLQSLQPLAKLASASLGGTNKVEVSLAAWRAFSLALLEYREGNYSAAVAWCERALEYQNSNPSRNANITLVLAMAHAQLSRKDQARAELEQARELIESRFKKGLQVGGGAEGFWFDWVFARVLLREATTLIEKTAAAAG
jgi:hypothetical protein